MKNFISSNVNLLNTNIIWEDLKRYNLIFDDFNNYYNSFPKLDSEYKNVYLVLYVNEINIKKILHFCYKYIFDSILNRSNNKKNWISSCKNFNF